ncbi:MAG: PEP-CTERM sorting domain-containing protein [Gemmatimonadaceae bacterium]
MRVLRALSLVIAAVATSEIAAAQPIGLKFQSGPPSPAVTGYGYYVGPFSGTVTSNPTLPTISLYCVDILNRITWGKTWNANLTNLGQTNLSNTRHGSAKLLQYRKAAWLTTQFSLNSTTAWAGIQAAIWNLLNPGAPNGGAAETFWLNKANTFASSTTYGTYNWNQFHIVTPVGAAGLVRGGGTQEFITPSVTPEPATLLLLATGLICTVGFLVVRTRMV